MTEEAKKLNCYAKKYHVEGLNELFQFIPYLKSLVVREHIDVDRIIASLPSEELIKQDIAQLLSLMRRAHCYFGFTVPVSYRIIESYIKGEDLSKYGERPIYIMKLNGETIMEASTFSTEELIGSIQKPKEYIRKKR